MKHNKKMKSIFTVGGLILTLSVLFCLGNMVVTKKLEVHAENVVNQEFTESTESGGADSRSYSFVLPEQEPGNDPERDEIAESDGFLKTSQELAEELLKEYGECPLLDENAEEHFGNSSLENMMNDINAAICAKDSITEICQENNIDVNSAKIKDLTKEQIVEIDQEVFRRSFHPIGNGE